MKDSRPTLRVAFTAHMLADFDLCGKGVVVIDILRASTTITHAVAEGARGVIPVRTVQKARILGERWDALVGGERKGVPPEGFDLGNSPADYSRPRVQNRLVVLTTSNGTVAVHNAASAAEMVVGCFNNLDAVVGRLRSSQRSWVLVCAGTDGGRRVALEDVLFAGEVVRRLQAHQKTTESPEARWQLSGSAVLARDFSVFRGGDVTQQLTDMPHGRALSALGHCSDVLRAARTGITTVVPRVCSCCGVCRGCPASDNSGRLLCIRAEGDSHHPAAQALPKER